MRLTVVAGVALFVLGCGGGETGPAPMSTDDVEVPPLDVLPDTIGEPDSVERAPDGSDELKDLTSEAPTADAEVAGGGIDDVGPGLEVFDASGEPVQDAEADAVVGIACESDEDCPLQECWDAACTGGACAYVPNSEVCEDMNVCTHPDMCVAGACLPGPNHCSEVCDNGQDDDTDGQIDCADDDCLVAPTCWATCHGQEVLVCGQQIFDTTDKVGATTLVGDACGLDGGGSEVIYRFVPPPNLLTATASLEGAGHVALLSPGGLGACEEPSCLDASQASWTWAPDILAEELFIVVDTPPGAEGVFALTLLCTFPLFESCSNGVDDDEDGAVDCDDSDCVDHPICGAPIEVCDNGVDDDLDGAVDCDDTNCVEAFACSPLPGCDPLYDLPCGVVLTDELAGSGSTDFMDLWNCVPEGLSGPEIAHRIAFDVDTHVALKLDTVVDGAQLLLVEDAEACDSDACLAVDPVDLAFVAEAGKSYAVVVDTAGDVAGTYTLSMDCATPELCDNDFDDDQDGQVDCEDADCFAVEPCLGQVCQASSVLDCDQTFGGVLAPTGGLDQSACGPTGAGGEFIAVFTADLPTDVVLSASGEGAPALFALDATGVCDTGLCLEGGDAQLALSMAPETSVYVVVDGEHGGAFQVSVNCQGTENYCADGVDDDADGSTDCADTDCLGAEGCAPSCPELGTITCGSFPLATPATGDSTIDGWGCPDAPLLAGPEVGWRLSVGGEVLETSVRVVLYDPDDSGATLLVVSSGATCDPMACLAVDPHTVEMSLGLGDSPYLLVDRPAGGDGEATVGIAVNCHGYENSCMDGVDGDGDGLQDCADPDCAAVVPPCETVEGNCQNGLDDDGDEAIDCEDSDCDLAFNCYVPVPICALAADLFCNEPLTVSTHDTWARPGPLTFDCPAETVEAVQGTFTSLFMGQGESVIIEAEDVMGAGHVVVVPTDDGVVCDPAACIASGQTPFAFDAALEQLYLVVWVSTDDTPAVADLTVQCETAELDCLDGVDDDGDGLTDCDDPGCEDLFYCSLCKPSPGLACDTTMTLTTAEAWEGMTDSLNEACGVPSPGPEHSFLWEPALDMDVTLASDSPDTRFHVFHASTLQCTSSACLQSGAGPQVVTTTADSAYVIVVDTVASGETPVEITVKCATFGEDCANGVDDDGDGQTDCEDTDDCKLFADCQPGDE